MTSKDEQSDYERGIDALCDALIRGDDFMQPRGATAEQEVVAEPACGGAAAVIAADERRDISTTSAFPSTLSGSRRRAPKRVGATGMSRRLGTIWLVTCLALAGWLGLRPPASPSRSSSAATSAAGVKSRFHKHASVAIEDIRVGQRVLGENPELSEAEHVADTAVGPTTWRLLKLHAEQRAEDGTLDTIEVETLQPVDWIAEHGARPGSLVPLPVDLVEMGMDEDLLANVVSVEPCPRIAGGSGHVVTTTINHLNAARWDLSVENFSGQRQLVKTTAFHKFYSDTRQVWVSASELHEGERLRGIDGTLTVTTSWHVPGIERVYNFSVEGEHVYQVSTLGVLVHNTNCVQVADARANTMIQNGQTGEVITLTFPLPRYGAVLNSAGQAISRNGIHVGVQSNGLIYDNLNQDGMPLMQWLAQFQSPFGLGSITIVPF